MVFVEALATMNCVPYCPEGPGEECGSFLRISLVGGRPLAQPVGLEVKPGFLARTAGRPWVSPRKLPAAPLLAVPWDSRQAEALWLAP